MKEILETKVAGMNLVFSKTVVVTTETPSVEFSGEFKLKLIFETEKKEDDKGQYHPFVKSKIEDGFHIKLFNFFNLEASVNDGLQTKFYKKKLKDENGNVKELFYHLYFATQSLSTKSNAMIVTVNILTTESDISEG